MAKTFLTPIDLAGHELRGATVEQLGAPPPSAPTARLYYHSGEDALYVRAGAAWHRLNLRPEDVAALLTADAAARQGVAQWLLSSDPVRADVFTAVVDRSADNDGLRATVLGSMTLAQVLSRASHTGTQAASTISDFHAQVRTNRLDQMAAPTANLNINSRRLTNVAAPTSAADAATKAYVDDAVVQAALGLDAKASVALRASVHVPTLSGTAVVIDEATPPAGTRVLLTAQTDPAQNGIYVVQTGAWTRAADAVPGSTLTPGALTFVEGGYENAGQVWILSQMGAAPGYAQTWVQFGAQTVYTGGTGITITGPLIAIDNGLVARKKTFALGGTAVQALTHGLGTRDVAVSVLRATAPYDQVEVGVEATDPNTVTLRFATAPVSGAYRAVVVG